MRILKFLFICCCLLAENSLIAQANLISNSDFEIAYCGDGNQSCPHFDDCVMDWSIAHGSPNYQKVVCEGEEGLENHSILMVCKYDVSEGIFTSVNLTPYNYRLFVRVRVTTTIPESNTARLRITLDQGLVHNIPVDNAVFCQYSIQSTDNTHLLYNQVLEENEGNWQWIIVDFEVTNETSVLDQIMFTGLCAEEDGQVNFQVDCISLYPTCDDVIVFNSRFENPLIIEDGSYISCSYIHSNPSGGASVVVPANAQIDLKATDYILFSPNFHAQHTLCASILSVPDVSDENFRPPCFGCPENEGSFTKPPEGANRTNGSNKGWETNYNNPHDLISISPNPANNKIEINIPKGEWTINIYNLGGVNLYQKISEGTISVNVEDWTTGLYFVEIMDTQTLEKSTFKVMIH